MLRGFSDFLLVFCMVPLKQIQDGLPRIPEAPRAIQKGVPLKQLLGPEAITCLAANIRLVHSAFDSAAFCTTARNGLDTLELMQRAQHIAAALRQHLPDPYRQAVQVLLASLTPPQQQAEQFGLAEFFYLPHGFFIADYGLEAQHDAGADPFDLSMQALHALTMRFTAEFAIRPFLIRQQERTLAQLMAWTSDANPHVRRLCSEGTRPRLPWGKRIPAFIADPSPALPILERLKDDDCLYVRRSVANHLGDIAKDHPEVALALCERWLAQPASKELKWVVRHALRHPAKKGDATALKLRAAAK
jgi:3-methyladenine DNA glycosylase AlkC